MPYRNAKPVNPPPSTWLEEWVGELVKAHAPAPVPAPRLVEKVPAELEIERFLRLHPPECTKCGHPIERLTTCQRTWDRQLEIVAECHGAREVRRIDWLLIAFATCRVNDQAAELVERLRAPYFSTFQGCEIDADG